VVDERCFAGTTVVGFEFFEGFDTVFAADSEIEGSFLDNAATVFLARLGGGSAGTAELERRGRRGPVSDSGFLAVGIEVSYHATIFRE
jgi:hypothetical protein